MKDDILNYLPAVKAELFPKGSEIMVDAASGIFMVVNGRVGLYHLSSVGDRKLLLDIYVAEDVFGENCFAPKSIRQSAIALEACSVMFWPVKSVLKIEGILPSLLGLVSERQIELAERLALSNSLSIGQRIIPALIHFAEKSGTEIKDDHFDIVMPPLSHEIISHYIGTSREIVTHYMNILRKQGKLKYSRQEIRINTKLHRKAA